jgi:hypothetical protein
MKTVLAAFAIALAVSASDVQKGNFGAEISGPSKTTAPAKAKRNSYPFSGEIETYDGKTLTLKGKKKARLLLITPETRVRKDGAPAKLKDGEFVSGSARKNNDGKEEAVTVNLKGAKPTK